MTALQKKKKYDFLRHINITCSKIKLNMIRRAVETQEYGFLCHLLNFLHFRNSPPFPLPFIARL